MCAIKQYEKRGRRREGAGLMKNRRSIQDEVVLPVKEIKLMEFCVKGWETMKQKRSKF